MNNQEKIIFFGTMFIFFFLIILNNNMFYKKLNKEMRHKMKYNERVKGLIENRNNLREQTKLQSQSQVFRNRVQDKLEEPARDYQNSRGLPINIRTRGRELPFQNMGFLYRDETDTNYNKDDVNRLMLFGRPQWSGSNKYDYYVTTPENNSIKIPIEDDNDELFDGETIQVTGFSGTFKIKLYEYKEYRYIPYLY